MIRVDNLNDNILSSKKDYFNDEISVIKKVNFNSNLIQPNPNIRVRE